MSILGGAYDDSPAADDASPAPAPAAEKPWRQGVTASLPASSSQLSIVDYHEGDGEEAEGPSVGRPPAGPLAAALGASLDDPSVQGAARRVGVGVSSVQISVVKKSPAHPSPARPAGDDADAADADADAAAAAAAADSAAARPPFVLPPSPPGDVDPKLAEKLAGLRSTTQRGHAVNEHIRNAKSFRNPDLLEKLVEYFDVRESGTNYPPELYDPDALAAHEYYDKLEEARRKYEERQARKPGQPVQFVGAGGGGGGGGGGAPDAPAPAPAPADPMAAATAAARAAAAAISGGAARKSKWGQRE
jgi:hypothetical protein